MFRRFATGALLLTVLTSVSAESAQRPRVTQQPYDPARHHQDLIFRPTIDRPLTFTLPVADSPIRVDLSASCLGYTLDVQPRPIVRSITIFYSALTGSTFLTDETGHTVTLTANGISFVNQPGQDGVRMTFSLATSSTGTPKELEVSVPQPILGFGQQFYNQLDIRMSLWY